MSIYKNYITNKFQKQEPVLVRVESPDISPQNLDQVLTVTANGTMTISYSPLHYMVRMQNSSTTLHTLLKALYNYHLAAKQL